jgi:hypothetical protein
MTPEQLQTSGQADGHATASLGRPAIRPAAPDPQVEMAKIKSQQEIKEAPKSSSSATSFRRTPQLKMAKISKPTRT